MTDHKFTDEEIVKALEVHSDTENPCMGVCPYSGDRLCGSKMAKDALALINRQKVKIEGLESNLKFVRGTNRRLIENESVVRAEAIKEFAQRLKKKMHPYNGVDKKKYAINAYAVEQAIECIAKEMTEETNDSNRV